MWRMRQQSADTLYVFCDQALGPWVPLVKRRPHIVHAHDLLALRSALGLIPQNPTSRTGQLYQRYIRWGFQQASHFVCVSKRTQQDLVEHGHVQPISSRVVYNGLNYPYKPVTAAQARVTLARAGLPDSAKAFVFPSLAEGFGWPIVEAQACGCPVLTTDDSPMNEIAGPHAHYLPVLHHGDDIDRWAHAGAQALTRITDTAELHEPAQRAQRTAWAGQFTTPRAIQGYLDAYQAVLQAQR
jgi:hypothetical protein